MTFLAQTSFCQSHTEFAVPDLWENVIITNLHTYFRWNQCCKIVPKIEWGNQGELAPPRGKEGSYLSKYGKSTCPNVLWGLWGRPMDGGMMYVVILDEMIGCLATSHPIYAEAGIFLYSH